MQLIIILHPVRLIRRSHRASCIIRRRRLVTQWKMGNRLRLRRPKPSLEVMASWKDGQFPLSLWSLSLSLSIDLSILITLNLFYFLITWLQLRCIVLLLCIGCLFLRRMVKSQQGTVCLCVTDWLAFSWVFLFYFFFLIPNIGFLLSCKLTVLLYFIT